MISDLNVDQVFFYAIFVRLEYIFIITDFSFFSIQHITLFLEESFPAIDMTPILNNLK